jgi:membrane-anchored protein YejM (alkaline phosphatase superfamily)
MSVDELKDQAAYDDTVVIVTADHGENLDEGIDGRRRYDHGNSINSQIFRVRLIIFYSNLESNKISSPLRQKYII